MVREAIRATTAAPTFFAPLMINGALYSDGALLCNNPSAVAFHEAKVCTSRCCSCLLLVMILLMLLMLLMLFCSVLSFVIGSNISLPPKASPLVTPRVSGLTVGIALLLEAI